MAKASSKNTEPVDVDPETGVEDGQQVGADSGGKRTRNLGELKLFEVTDGRVNYGENGENGHGPFNDAADAKAWLREHVEPTDDPRKFALLRVVRSLTVRVEVKRALTVEG